MHGGMSMLYVLLQACLHWVPRFSIGYTPSCPGFVFFLSVMGIVVDKVTLAFQLHQFPLTPPALSNIVIV
jgi:hypothetical protein